VNWTELLKSEIDGTYGVTLKLLNRVNPEWLSWKPERGFNWMTVGQLLKHIGNACGAGCKGFVTGDWGLPPGVKLEDLSEQEMMPPAELMPSVESVAQSREALLGDKAVALEMVERAGEEALAGREMAAPWAPAELYPLGWHLLKMVQHLDRHKAQLYYYLKLLGEPVKTPDLWG